MTDKSPHKAISFNRSTHPFTSQEIINQQERILASKDFHATESQRKLFNFIINQTVCGNSDQIKGYTIATQVFGRNHNFDQNTDPVVSIHANKLRRALERYYLTTGIHDTLRIDIPKGAYIPVFNTNDTSQIKTRSINESKTELTGIPSWPAVLVKPFDNHTTLEETNFLGVGFASELSIALSRYQDIRVMMYRSEENSDMISKSPARFYLEGSVRKDETKIFINVQLIDSITNMQLLGESYNISNSPHQIFAFQEEVAEKVALSIAGEHGKIAKTMLLDSKGKPPNELTTYEAILRYYEYDRLFNPDTYLAAVEALTYASKKEPDCGHIWTLLGRLHADNIVHEYFDTDITLDQALSYTAKGVLINPDNQRAWVFLAALRMFNDDITAARAEAERALSLNPKSLFFMDVIGYLLTLLGDWDRGIMLIDKALSQNPFNHNFVHYALWLNHFRTEDYERAYLETMNIMTTGNFWEPLTKAATLGHMDRIQEGTQTANKLLTLKPNFKTEGRRLIKYYIKFDHIVDQVINGLSNVGVLVD